MKVKKEPGLETHPVDIKKVGSDPSAPFEKEVLAASSGSASASSGAALVPLATPSSGPTSTNMEAAGKDISSSFIPLEEEETGQATELSTKERFLRADLLVPGIALKKFKMSLDSCSGPTNHLIALLSSGDIERYKSTRPMLQCMIMGDLSQHADFWEEFSRHFKNKPVTAVVFPSSGEMTLPQAAAIGFDFLLFGLFIVSVLKNRRSCTRVCIKIFSPLQFINHDYSPPL